jgi:hypothetical protein
MLTRTAHHELQLDCETGVGLTGIDTTETIETDYLNTEDGDRLVTEVAGVGVWEALVTPGTTMRWSAGHAGRIVAIQNVQQVYTSDDFGSTWTFRTSLPVSIGANSVSYGGGLWVVPCNSSTQVFTSPDGEVWTLRTVASPGAWYAHAYGNGTHVVNATNTARNLTSTDGVTWTIQTGYPYAHLVAAIAFGNGRFVSIASNGQGAWTTDGATWTGFTLPVGLQSLAFGDGLFVAVNTANFPGVGTYATSTDGETWTTRTLPVVAVWRAIQYGNGYWVMLGAETSYVSPTGVDGWVEFPTAIGAPRTWNTYLTFVAPYFYTQHLGSTADGQRLRLAQPGEIAFIILDKKKTQGVIPKVMLRWSDDGGHTWSREHWREMGRVGKFGVRVIWRRLGMTLKLRDRVYEVSGTDPVKITIVGAELRASKTNA